MEGQVVALGCRYQVAPLLAQGLLVRRLVHSVTTEQPIYIVASRSGQLGDDAVFRGDRLIADAKIEG